MEEITLSNINETILHDTCENGLDIYMWVNPNVNNFNITLNVKYGSVDTEFKLSKKDKITVPNGIAHFLEHVKFNEENGKNAFEHFSKLGSSANAFTTFDFTSYLLVASSHFKDNLEHLLNYVYTPVFTKENVEKEKGIILEEINMYQDIPGTVRYYKMLECLYKKDKMRIDILGSSSSVKSITPKDLKIVFETFYHPKNMFIVITGNFNPEEAITIIKENLTAKKFSRFKNPERVVPKEPVPVVNDYLELEQNVEIPKLNISYKMNRKNFKNVNNYVLSYYLAAILKVNFGVTSDFNESLLKNNLIIGGIKYIVRVKNDTVVIGFKTETNYPKEIITKMNKKMKNLEIDENTLNRIKKINLADYVASFDDIEVVNSIIQSDLVAYDKVVADVYEIINNLNITKATNIINGIDASNKAVVVGYPKKMEESTSEN